MADKNGRIPKEVYDFGLPVLDKVRALMEMLIPLPCLEMDDCSEFVCQDINDEECLCKTRRRLGDELAAAISLNRYDPLNPEYKKLSRKEKNLLLRVHQLKGGYVPPPRVSQRKGRE